MTRMLLIFWLCLAIGFVGFVGYQANKSRACYVVAQQDLDDLSFRASQNIAFKQTQCRGEYTVIQTLDACIEQSHVPVPEKFRKFVVPLITRVTRLLRYGGKDIATLQSIHDVECSQYPATMFVPPELSQ